MIRAVRLFCQTLALCMLAPSVSAQEDLAQFGTGPQPFVLRSTTDIAIIQPVLSAFAEANPDLTITYEQWNSNPLYAQAVANCDGDSGAADALFSSAVQQMLSLVNAGCAQPHQSELTDRLADDRKWRDELWGLTEEPAVIVYNTELLAGADVPRTRFALLDLMRSKPEQLQGKIATYDIAASGLGFLFAFADSLEATTFGALLEGFARTNAVATCCSAEIIDGVSTGKYALAYNVLGSYVINETRPNLGLILPEDYTIFLSRTYMIPRAAQNPQAAKNFLDFMLSADGQELLTQAGLRFQSMTDDQGLLDSARRFIGLDPSLLVALDRQKRDQFFTVWSNNFVAPPSTP